MAKPSSASPSFHPLPALRTLGRSSLLAVPYTPDQLAISYGFQPLYDRGIDGTGQTVALLEVGKFNPSDLREFDDFNNLDPPHLKQFFVGGHSFRQKQDDETTMDVEWLHALAPGAAIRLYYLKNGQPIAKAWKSMAMGLRAANAGGASIISVSLGACGAGRRTNPTRLALADLERRGVSVFVASGDNGDRPGSVNDCGHKIGVSYPSGDPSVVSVGGTSVQLNNGAFIANETAWRWSGGGRVLLPRPPWQSAPHIPRDRYRWAPDVAFDGDPKTGVAFYYKGHWRQVGGTSLGAPCWAAAWSLIRENAKRSGRSLAAAPPLIYRVGNSPSYARAFHDVIHGNNGHYRAGPGWDAVTGWGTPNVVLLASAVLNSTRAR